MPDPPVVPGHRTVHLEETDSTNRRGVEGVRAGALEVGDVLVADAQTTGRGRRGRSWVTVPGRSLAMSVVIRPGALPRPGRIAVLAAVAARRALAAHGANDVALKWPNDLMRAGRKIGGLLVETARPPTGPDALVVGLGVNLALRPGDVPEDLAPLVGDAGLTADRATRDGLLAAFVAQLDAALAELGTAADRARGEEYRAASWLTGRRVSVDASGARRTGTVTDVTPDGDLVLDGTTLAGETLSLCSVEGRPGLGSDA